MKCEASINKESLILTLSSKREKYQSLRDTSRENYSRLCFEGFNKAIETRNAKRNQNFWTRLFNKPEPLIENESKFDIETYSSNRFFWEYMESSFFPEEHYHQITKSKRNYDYANEMIILIDKVLSLCKSTTEDFVVLDHEMWSKLNNV